MHHARPKRLLGAEMPPEERAWIDARLAVLGRGVRAMRLRLGEGLSRLEAVGGVRELGFPNLESYCREALGRSGRWGADARSLARRLSGLPRLRAALVDGRLTSSMVELLARVASAEDEGRWIAEAAGSTVRAMRQKVSAARAQSAANEDDPDVREGARVTLCVTADRVDAWARELAWRDMDLAALARRCFESELWLRFGWASFEQYGRERVGLSASSMTTRVTLSRRVGELPQIEGAVGEGRIGYEAATLIARVGGPCTVEAWIERAEARTVKLLRQEVEAVEMLARADGKEVTEIEPPDDEVMEEVRGIERAVIGVVSGAIQMSGRGEGGVDAAEVGALPTRTLKLTMSEETARFWRALEAVHARSWVEGSFLAFLVRAVMKAWRGARPVKDEYRDVYLRERWRCASPVCESRNVTTWGTHCAPDRASDGSLPMASTLWT